MLEAICYNTSAGSIVAFPVRGKGKEEVDREGEKGIGKTGVIIYN